MIRLALASMYRKYQPHVGKYVDPMGYDNHYYQRATGYTPNSVPMVFIVFSRDSWG